MFSRFFSLPPALSPPQRSNLVYLLADSACWSLYLGSINTFLAIYASRCGATSRQIGLITALPALIAIFISLPIGSWIRGFHIQKVTVWAAFTSRILLILFAVIPLVFPLKDQIYAILVLVAIITFPTSVINISFTQLLNGSRPG